MTDSSTEEALLDAKWEVRRERRARERREPYDRGITRIERGSLSAIAYEDMDVASSKLCVMCRIMFLGSSTWEHSSAPVQHHDLIYPVIVAARQGCGLCSMLMGIIYAEQSFAHVAALNLHQAEGNWDDGPHFQFLLRASRISLDESEKIVLGIELRQIASKPKPLDTTIAHTAIHLSPAYTEPSGSSMHCAAIGTETPGIIDSKPPVPSIYATEPPIWEHRLPLVKAWLQECIDNHDCVLVPSSLPTRLLSIKEGPIHIINTSKLPIGTKYCTLSHCWGPNPDLTWQLKRSNLKSYEASIPSNAFFKTFQDAIYIASSLGVGYLWIDSLCIIQQDTEDFQREATRMSTIYGNSYLNIVATSASNGSEGCFSSHPFLPFSRAEIEAEGQCYQARPKHLYKYGFLNTPVSSRAWCFQERVLAPRTLHFSKAQLFWDCNSKFEAECFPSVFPGSDYIWLQKKDLGSHWSEMIYQYTGCKLSDPNDKLIAFAGVIKRMEQQLQDKCYAGIWESNVETNLLWCYFRPKPVHEYRAPSWSWASIDGEINTPDLAEQPSRTFGRVLDIRITPCGDNPLGKLRGGTLKVACRTLVNISNEVNEAFSNASGNVRRVFFEAWDAHIQIFGDSTSLPLLCDNVFYAMPLVIIRRKVKGLIITPGDKGLFHRIGMFSVLDGDESGIVRHILDSKSRAPELVFLDGVAKPEHASEDWIIEIV